MRRLLLGLVGVSLLVHPGPESLLGQSPKVRVAVLDFQNNSTWAWWGDNLGQAASDELTTQLVKSGRFSVIERRQLDQVLAEQNLGESGAVNPATAAKIGELLGVQVVLLGSITQFSVDRKSGGIGPLRASFVEGKSKIDVRAVNTSIGEIIAVSEGEGKKRIGGVSFQGLDFQADFDQGLAQEALRPAVEDAVKGLMEYSDEFAALKPAASTANIVGSNGENFYLDRGENFGIQPGQRFEVYRVVDEIKDDSGNVLDQVTDKVGTLEVTRVLSKSSICKVVEGEARKGDQARSVSDTGM